PTGRDTRATRRPVLPWLVVMLVLGAAAVTLGVQRLEALPDPYPTHFDLSGEADGFSDRSLGSVLMPVVMGQLGGLLVFAMTLLPRRSSSASPASRASRIPTRPTSRSRARPTASPTARWAASSCPWSWGSWADSSSSRWPCCPGSGGRGSPSSPSPPSGRSSVV